AKDPEAICHLGTIYNSGGYGLEKDQSHAIKLLYEAAELGSTEALTKIGVSYYRGSRGVPHDKAKGIHCWESAAMLGCADSRHFLGIAELEKMNPYRAMRHLLIAAKMGYEESLDAIKDLFSDGLATKAQYAEALKGYQDAVEETKSPELMPTRPHDARGGGSGLNQVAVTFHDAVITLRVFDAQALATWSNQTIKLQWATGFLELNSRTRNMNKVGIFVLSILTVVKVAEGGPAGYAVCQSGCAAAAGIAMCMSGGSCSSGKGLPRETSVLNGDRHFGSLARVGRKRKKADKRRRENEPVEKAKLRRRPPVEDPFPNSRRRTTCLKKRKDGRRKRGQAAQGARSAAFRRPATRVPIRRAHGWGFGSRTRRPELETNPRGEGRPPRRGVQVPNWTLNARLGRGPFRTDHQRNGGSVLVAGGTRPGRPPPAGN
ncbi:hypothetical protein THAOC_16332, partial [Thalassiosira oceanica]